MRAQIKLGAPSVRVPVKSPTVHMSGGEAAVLGDAFKVAAEHLESLKTLVPEGFVVTLEEVWAGHTDGFFRLYVEAEERTYVAEKRLAKP